MNLIKLYCIGFFVLALCSPESDGLFFGFLLRLMLLKSALFVGMPIAIGSFMMGQGVGFLGGTMAGGYGMLRASQRYHDAEKLKWTGGGISSGYGYAAAPVVKPHKKHPIIDFLKAKYPYDPHYSHKHQPITESYYGGGGYGSGGYNAHSHVSHDTRYVAVTKGHSHGHDKYAKGFNKGIFLGALNKGFKAGLRHPYGGQTQFPHSHKHVETPVHTASYGVVHSDHGFGGYGYESQQPVYHSIPSKGYGPSPSIFQRVMSFPTSIFKSGKKPTTNHYGSKPPIHYIKPEYGHQQLVHQSAGYQPAYTTTVVQPETTLESYDGPGKEYTGIIAGGGGYADTSYPSSNSYSSISHGASNAKVYGSPGAYSSSDISSVSVHEEPDYANVGGEAMTEQIKSYGVGHDQPKSEPMGINYFSNEYDPNSQPGIASDDLIQAFGSSFPTNPNTYAGGKPYADSMGQIEFDTYRSSSNGHDPLDVQASIAFDVSSEFGAGTRRTSVTKKSSEEDTDKNGEPSILVSNAVPAPNAIIEKFLEEKLEEKARKAQGEIEKKEARHLIVLLRKAYIQQLIDSLNLGRKPSEKQEDIPDFKPLPIIPNSTTEPATMSSTENPSSAEAESPEKTEDSTESWKRRIEIELTKGSLGDRPKRHSTDSTTDPSSSQDSAKSSEIDYDVPAPAMSKEEHAKFVENFLTDVKSFFVLVSALDQDTCLQKLVCDVHTRTGQTDLTTYESNIISTFRIMDTLISLDEEDSSTIYRRAARVGEIGGSSDICQKTYASCGYSANQIISLGKQVETADSSNFNFGDIENIATAMPRV